MNDTNKRLVKGIINSIYASVILTFIGTIINSFLLYSAQDFLLVFVLMSLIISIITLLVSALFGTFIVLVLEELNIENYITTSIIGGCVGYILGFIIFSDWTFMVLIFSFYGTYCGFAFSYGYNKEVRK